MCVYSVVFLSYVIQQVATGYTDCDNYVVKPESLPFPRQPPAWLMINGAPVTFHAGFCRQCANPQI